MAATLNMISDVSQAQYTTVSSKQDGLIQVSKYCPERPYVELRIPTTMKRVQSVKFKTLSHDQGFSDGPTGTYEYSNTWFEAAMINASGHDIGPRKIFQYNIAGDFQMKKHEVLWDFDKVDNTVRSWLKLLQGGDYIQIILRAQYPGWVNFVYDAEIELLFIDGLEDEISPSPLDSLAIQSSTEQTRKIFRELDTGIMEIRLIELSPGVGEDPIQCSLIYTSLYEATNIPYDCLSYCWGDSKDKKDILLSTSRQEDLDQLAFPVTSSLYSALKSLRLESGHLRTVWVDAICIDQSDFQERSQQVGIMKDIYSRAKEVIIWLGDGDEITSKCIKTIKTVSSRYQDSSTQELPEKTVIEMHDPLLADHASWHWFLSEFPLFDMPYFRRTWVLQEVYNARSATVHCGQDVLPWSMVLRVNKCMSILRHWRNSFYKGVLPPLFSDLLNFHQKELMVGGLDRPASMEILEVLIRALDLDATDPRDKIFAMLQFGEDTKNLDLLPLEIRPNYHKSTVQLFMDFTRWWIVSHKSLRILSAVHAETGRTWQEMLCPAYQEQEEDVRPTWSLWHKGNSNYAEGILGLSDRHIYFAAADTIPDINLLLASQGTSELPLVGYEIGTIERIQPYPYYAIDPQRPELYSELHDVYVNIFDPLNLTEKWSASIYSASKHKVAPEHRQDENAWIQHSTAHAEHVEQTEANACHSKCFFTTVNGIVGLCPFMAREGDVITILFGGNVPYILRRQEVSEKYEFIGECFLSGYMEGRALRERQAKHSPTQVFTLV